jgi:triacylglycerol lipase
MKAPRLRSPIVLVHGLFGFDQVRLGKWVLANYFNAIPHSLRSAGNQVLVPRLSPTGGIADRAAQLKTYLNDNCPGEPVHLLAHSMGGLDSRFMISRLGMANRVLTLTTLGTPHHGSAFADWAEDRVVRLLHLVCNFLRLPQQAFRDLTTASCARFNQETPAMAGVRYFSIGGLHHRKWLRPTWNLSGPIVEKAEGPNDGIVSLTSAQYGESFDVWEADHINLVNWSAKLPLRKQNPSRLPQYAGIIQRLTDEGY